MTGIGALIVVALVTVTGCGQDTAETTAPGASVTEPAPATTASAPDAGQTFTLDDLAQFDGKEGRAAYVAVDGVVYDLTDSRSWPEGAHTSCNLGAMAGRDLSAEIEQAPANMRGLLEAMPVVGTLEQ